MLKDKVAIITGGSRGIGREIARYFAEQGANVVVNYFGSEEKALEVVAEIEGLGQKAIAVKADVANSGDVDMMIKTTIATFGKVDILVNNAGITKDTLIMRMKEDDWDSVVNTNLKSVFLCTKAVSRHMTRQRSGKIINISSIVGAMGNAGQANYVAAKAAVIGLTKTTAREFASRNINVNAIAPGFISTDMTSALSEEIQGEMLKNIPLGRFGDPIEIAKAAAFLASEDSNYITGQTIHVNGGMYM